MTKSRSTGTVLPLETSLGYQIRATHRLFQRYLQGKIEPFGVSLGMWYFLRVLWEEDGLTQRELSQRVGTMEPTTLTALRSMERSGFIRRERNADDGRKINVFLTEEGRALQEKLLPLAREVVEDAASTLTRSDKEAMLELLAKVQLNLSAKTER
ncbi:MarR family transcriptional regulator [Georhizobium profundi]|jgi:MarR family transcriptional regulator, organic hydroperoxide resistance regulator|uniref:MarR family transcriptional regulator n=1 Tax=Georhizobium profundi TaxID=2341112 RepID=A0A3S9B0X4_9HYPH|nr:MarR family transcriptional regulator [Georhizobium profundi]AZN70491.1 MarR family transcriptional regulator [Georhizobium profundi]